MALQPREKRLALVVAVLGVVVGAWILFASVRGAFDRRQTQLTAVNAEVQKKRMQVALMGLTTERFFEWEKRSLPRDRDVARSAYQSWLIATLDTAGLEQVHVDPGRTTVLKDIYARVPYSIRTTGTLEQVSRWLAVFYRAGHLHQLRDLSLQPDKDGRKLQVSAMVEALILPEADRKDKLAEAVAGPIDEARGKAAVDAIVTRNLFAAYVPPPPPRPPVVAVQAPPPPPKFDESKHTFLTSIIFVDAKPEAWLSVRPTKQLLRLHEGDGIEVGLFTGKLVRIGAQEIEIERDGRRQVIALGKSLGQTVELPAVGL